MEPLDSNARQPSAASVDCEGWWEQWIYGRQPMTELRLAFCEGRIRGAGVDIIGTFVLNGLLSPDGNVVMVKQYIGKHSVDYVGKYDGEGRLWGTWRLGSMTGPWSIQIKRSRQAIADEIQELSPID